MSGDQPNDPRAEQVKREEIVKAIEKGISSAGSRISDDEKAKLLTVANDATRLAVGSESLEDDRGRRVNCPLAEAGLWDSMNSVAQHRFYRAFDTTMGPGFVILEVTD